MILVSRLRRQAAVANSRFRQLAATRHWLGKGFARRRILSYTYVLATGQLLRCQIDLPLYAIHGSQPMHRTTFFFVMLLSGMQVQALENSVRTSFSVNVPLADVARRLDSMESLRRLFQSQDIEVLDYKLTNRKLEFWKGTIAAQARIEGLAPRLSCRRCEIEQTAEMSLKRAALAFKLVQPVGQLAAQRYRVEMTAHGKQTKITLQLYSRVYTPQSRLCCIQRLIYRVAYRRLLNEQYRYLAALSREVRAISAQPRPAGARSLIIR